MSTGDDQAADRRIAVTIGGLMAVEVVLAGVADAGGIALWLWLVLAIAAVLAAGCVNAVLQRRAERTAVGGHRPDR